MPAKNEPERKEERKEERAPLTAHDLAKRAAAQRGEDPHREVRVKHGDVPFAVNKLWPDKD